MERRQQCDSHGRRRRRPQRGHHWCTRRCTNGKHRPKVTWKLRDVSAATAKRDRAGGRLPSLCSLRPSSSSLNAARRSNTQQLRHHNKSAKRRNRLWAVRSRRRPPRGVTSATVTTAVNRETKLTGRARQCRRAAIQERAIHGAIHSRPAEALVRNAEVRTAVRTLGKVSGAKVSTMVSTETGSQAPRPRDC